MKARPGSAERAEGRRRLRRLQAGLRRRRLDATIVFDRTNVVYLTGFRSSLSYLIVTPREAVLFVDGRYIEAARATVRHCEVELFKKIGETLARWRRRIRPSRVGLEGSIPWSQWREFGSHLPGVELVEAEELILRARLIKSSSEIRSIQASARLNDAVYESTLQALRPGMTELDVRRHLRAEVDRLGVEGQSFDCIIASGPAASRPHYVPSANRLRRGDLFLIDMGMLVDGYCSDMTRVVALGSPPKARLRRAFDAVLEAEEAALREVGPGVKAADLHRLAVEKLRRRGLAGRFTHGLGHGVGLQIHEAPVLNAYSTDVLRAGMVITIEPGVYLPGQGGVRIEDLVLVTSTGHRVLSGATKTFRMVPFEA